MMLGEEVFQPYTVYVNVAMRDKKMFDVCYDRLAWDYLKSVKNNES